MAPTQAIELFIASDHAGLELKEALKELTLKSNLQIQWTDLGTNTETSCDYPDFAEKLSKEVLKTGKKGVLICGSGVGMSMAANRHSGIRAVLAHNEFAAKLSRMHNDSNVLCLGARVTAPAYAKEILTIWLNTGFEGGRHAQRIAKL